MKKWNLAIVALFMQTWTLSSFALGPELEGKTICGRQDDRVPSFNPKVARVLEKGEDAGCTLTLIGRSCALSAGHCKPTFELAEFNTPLSSGGNTQRPEKEDIYEVDKSSVVSTDGGRGNDFAILRLKPNRITGKLPGDLQGFYQVSFELPKIGDIVNITGYGSDRSDRERHFAQQFHAGPITSISRSGSKIGHRADTTGGSSGSSIIHQESGKIIAIHTHGGCIRSRGENGATLLAKHEKAKKAILSCLQWENDHL